MFLKSSSLQRDPMDVKKKLITNRFRLEEFEKALATVDNPAEKPLKVIVTD
jgi:threonine dehydrogenase-like Zn-dependent dehydrogenase